jgi:hypothetical protein
MGHLNSFKTSEEGMLAPLSLIQRLLLFHYSLVLFYYFGSGNKEEGKKKWCFLVS